MIGFRATQPAYDVWFGTCMSTNPNKGVLPSKINLYEKNTFSLLIYARINSLLGKIPNVQNVTSCLTEFYLHCLYARNSRLS